MIRLPLILFVLVSCNPCFAAINAAVVWEVRTTGVSTNGGGFKTGASGTDWTQQDACKYSLTGLTSAGAGNVILTASAAADWVGNIINIASGTNFTVGFFEITSVSAGVSATVSTNQAGTAISTGVGASGVGCIGGAFKFGTSKDSTFGSGIAAGNTVYVQSGTYTQNTSVAFTDCTNLAPCTVIGYNSTRTDEPTGSNRPTINLVATQWNPGALTHTRNIIFSGTQQTPLTSNGQNVWYNDKFINTSTTAGRFGISEGSDDLILNSEVISYNGIGINCSGDCTIIGNYIHDSATGIKWQPTGSPVHAIGNIFDGNVTNGIQISAANTAMSLIYGNTFYGTEAKLGTHLNIASGASDVRVINNIFYGAATAISAAAANANLATYNNDFNNNTSNVSSWSTGTNAITTSPAFKNAAQYTGTTATSSSTTLTDSGAAFTNVVNNQDFVYVSASTGGNTGKFLITGHTATTLTTDNSLGTGSSITYTVTTGHNFAPGINVVNKGIPGAFPASLTTSYPTLGAVHKMPGYPRSAKQ
jgi:hypothetical protein